MADVVEQKMLLTAIEGRINELRSMLPDSDAASFKQPKEVAATNGSGSEKGRPSTDSGTDLFSRVWQSGLMKGVRRAASGVLAVALYYADVYSDVTVLLLLYDTGNYVWAATGCFLLVAQFVVVYLRVLPYLAMSFGRSSVQFRGFLILGFPMGLLVMDAMMFLEPFGLLTVLPMPERLRQFIPAYKATRIIAEVMVESLPQCVLQSFIFVVVMHNTALGIASPSEIAMLSFASLLPKSILIGSLAILKTWIELVHSAREAGLSVRTKAIQLWQVGAGLPLDALKKGTIVEWVCPYVLEEAEVPPLLDALGKNASLTHLDLSSAGLSWSDANYAFLPLIKQMARGSTVLGSLQTLVISKSSGYEVPVGQLRSGREEAMKALLATRFFGMGSAGMSFTKKQDPRDRQAGARREEILLMGDLLRKSSSSAGKENATEADAVTKLLAAARKGAVERSVWEQQIARMIVSGSLRRGHLLSLLVADCLHDVGFKADHLLAVGFNLARLRSGGYTARELKEVGLSAKALRDVKYSARELREAAYSAKEVKSAAFPINELYNGGWTSKALRAVGYAAEELKGGGYTASNLRDAGFVVPPSLRPRDLCPSHPPCPSHPLCPSSPLSAECADTAGLLLVWWWQPRELKPPLFDVSALRDAGFSAQSLRDVRLTLSTLQAGGYSALELRQAGYHANELRDVGFSASDVRAAGFLNEQMRAAGFTASEMKAASVSAKKLKLAGYSAQEALEAGWRIEVLMGAGYSASQLRTAGCTAAELEAVGCELADLRTAGYSAAELQAIGYRTEALRAVGVSLADLHVAGASAVDLRSAGISAIGLKAEGISLWEIKAAGYSIKELKLAGFTSQEMHAAQFAAHELTAAGFTAKELKAGGYTTAEELRQAGCSVSELRLGGFLAKELRLGGFSAEELAAGGFVRLPPFKLKPRPLFAKTISAHCAALVFVWMRQAAKELRAGGFSVSELRAADLTAGALKAVGFPPRALKAGGFSALDLKECGFKASDLFDKANPNGEHCSSVAELMEAGFSCKQLRLAGVPITLIDRDAFSIDELHDSGYDAAALRAYGCTPEQISQLSYGAKELRVAGFMPGELLECGFDVDELVNCGFGISALIDAGIKVSALLEVGVGVKELRSGGVLAVELLECECSVDVMKRAGFKAEDLKYAGVGAREVTGCRWPERMSVIHGHARHMHVQRMHAYLGGRSLSVAAVGEVACTRIDQPVLCMCMCPRSSTWLASQCKLSRRRASSAASCVRAACARRRRTPRKSCALRASLQRS